MIELENVRRKKIPKTFKLDPLTVKQLETLAEKQNATCTAILEYCVDSIYKQLLKEE